MGNELRRREAEREMRPVKFQLLGQVRAHADDTVVELGGPQPQQFLMALLHNRDRVATELELVEWIWDVKVVTKQRHEAIQHLASKIHAVIVNGLDLAGPRC